MLFTTTTARLQINVLCMVEVKGKENWKGKQGEWFRVLNIYG